MIKTIPRYEDHLWYPILVKMPWSTYYKIIEMQGREVNRWNDAIVEKYHKDTKDHPRGWRI